MKTAFLLPFLAIPATLLLGGCQTRLPNIKAEEIHQRTTVAGVFVSTADASGINITDTTIKAAEAKWTVSLFGFDSTTTAKGYQQRRSKETEEK